MRGTVERTSWMIAAAALAGALALQASGRTPPPRRAPAGRGTTEHPSQESSGAGVDADTPSAIPARGWWDILKRAVSEAGSDRLLTEAAGVTFYTLLALFPGIAALVSLYGLVADPATVSDHLGALSGFIPGGGMEIINEQVTRITSKEEATLGLSALIGLALSLWSANQAAKALFDALNVVYEEKEKRSFIRLNLVSLTFTLGGILFAVLAMGAVIALPVILTAIGLGGTTESLLRIARWPLLLLGIALALACLYRWGPSRAEARWRWVTWGSAFAAIAWLAFSGGFSFYVENFGSYNETYGSLGAVIGFMTWIWLSAAVVLFGGELNAEAEHQTARDTTTGPELPIGTRDARMADRVAPG
jgi:membrane protein